MKFIMTYVKLSLGCLNDIVAFRFFLKLREPPSFKGSLFFFPIWGKNLSGMNFVMKFTGNTVSPIPMQNSHWCQASPSLATWNTSWVNWTMRICTTVMITMMIMKALL